MTVQIPHLTGWKEHVQFEIECRRSSNGPTVRHLVGISPEWEVTTPHDLEAEAVARAFGDTLTCLELAESTIPAFQQSLPALVRQQRVEVQPFPPTRGRLQRGLASRWAPALRQGGCCGFEFESILDVARHVRSARHIVQVHGGQLWQMLALHSAFGSVMQPSRPDLEQLEPLVDAMGFVIPSPDVDPANLAVEFPGAMQLWDYGIAPRRALAHHARAGASGPLLLSYFVAMEYLESNPEPIAIALAVTLGGRQYQQKVPS